jgi:hypothetical protein
MTIFKINESESIKPYTTQEKISEKKLEEIIFNSLMPLQWDYSTKSKTDENLDDISKKIFGESGIFRINRQQRFKATNKVSDILAIDSEGRIVVMELKKDSGKVGVDMQALQYLVQIKSYPTGLRFFESGHIKSGEKDKKSEDLANAVRYSFGDDDRFLEKINKEQRIVLIAQDFDESLFSMGEWLSEKGVGFTCISYEFYKFGEDEFISFSTKFDAKPYNSYQLSGSVNSSNSTAVPYYYHNSGCSIDEVKDFIKNGEIGCGFDGKKFDEGYRILNEKYNSGDHIFLYQSGYGIIAVGKVAEGKLDLEEKDENDNKYRQNKGYRLLEGSKILPHRLKVKWEASVSDSHKAFKRNQIQELKTKDGLKTMLLPIPKTSSAISRNEEEANKFYEVVKQHLQSQ